MFGLDAWEITDEQQDAVRDLIENAETTERFEKRRTRNVNHQGLTLNRDTYWKATVVGVVTTRLESGKGSPVHTFLNLDNFPLGLERLRETETDTTSFVQQTLADHGIPGKRRGRYIAANHDWFQAGGAEYLMQIGQGLETLAIEQPDTQSVHERLTREIQAALAIQPYLLGIGPKQARNYWQWLGLFQWEIPLDSRILSWIERIPDTPSSIDVDQSDLSDETTYRKVMNWVQTLSRSVDQYPCLVDAAVFELTEN